MAFVARFASVLERIAATVSMIVLAALLALVAASVLGRLVFDLTGGAMNPMIRGNIEVASYLLLTLVLASLPVTIGSGFVRVDIFVDALPAAVGRALDRLWSLLFAVFAVAVGRLFLDEAYRSAASGAVSQDLALPLSAIYGLGTALLALVAVVAVARTLAPIPHESLPHETEVM